MASWRRKGVTRAKREGNVLGRRHSVSKDHRETTPVWQEQPRGGERCEVRMTWLQELFPAESNIRLSSSGWVPGTLGAMNGFNSEGKEQICILDPLAATRRDKTRARKPRQETIYPWLEPSGPPQAVHCPLLP